MKLKEIKANNETKMRKTPKKKIKNRNNNKIYNRIASTKSCNKSAMHFAFGGFRAFIVPPPLTRALFSLHKCSVINAIK